MSALAGGGLLTFAHHACAASRHGSGRRGSLTVSCDRHCGQPHAHPGSGWPPLLSRDGPCAEGLPVCFFLCCCGREGGRSPFWGTPPWEKKTVPALVSGTVTPSAGSSESQHPLRKAETSVKEKWRTRPRVRAAGGTVPGTEAKPSRDSAGRRQPSRANGGERSTETSRLWADTKRHHYSLGTGMLSEKRHGPCS